MNLLLHVWVPVKKCSNLMNNMQMIAHWLEGCAAQVWDSQQLGKKEGTQAVCYS